VLVLGSCRNFDVKAPVRIEGEVQQRSNIAMAHSVGARTKSERTVPLSTGSPGFPLMNSRLRKGFIVPEGSFCGLNVDMRRVARRSRGGGGGL
jgi:hypothetical protein